MGVRARRSTDAGGSSWAAFPVVATFYGGALYGLATAAQQRLREHWLASSGFLEAGRGVGLTVGVAGLFVFTFSDAADELGQAGDELSGFLVAGLVLLAALALAGAGALALSRRPSGRVRGGNARRGRRSRAVAVLLGGSGDAYAVLFNILFAAVAPESSTLAS